MITEPSRTNEARIRDNVHFARFLRQRLESRHGKVPRAKLSLF